MMPSRMSAPRSAPRPNPWPQRLELALWGVALLTTLAFIVIKARAWGPLDAPEQLDFATYYLAAQVGRRAPEHLYDQAAWDAIVDRPTEHGLPAYVYLPTFAWLLRPLATLPYAVARRIWFWASVAAMLITAVAMGVAGKRKRDTLAGVALWLLLPAGLDTLFHGQVNTFIALAVTLGVLGWASERRGWQFAGGVLVGIAGAVKIFPLFLAAMALWGRKWRFGMGCAAGLLLFAALGLPGMPWVAWQDFADVLMNTGDRLAPPGGGALLHNQSVLAFWRKLAVAGPVSTTLQGRRVAFTAHPLLPPSAARILGYGSAMAVVAVTAVAIWKLYHGPGDRDAAWSLALLAVMLASPVMWWHYATAFAPLFPALIAARGRIPAAWRPLIPAGYLLMVVQRGMALWMRFIPVLAASSVMMVGVLLMWFALARCAWAGEVQEPAR